MKLMAIKYGNKSADRMETIHDYPIIYSRSCLSKLSMRVRYNPEFLFCHITYTETYLAVASSRFTWNKKLFGIKDRSCLLQKGLNE